MPTSQLYVNSNTPLGVNLVSGGATFRTWAPSALEVYVVINQPPQNPAATFVKNPSDLLVKDDNGYWGGFVSGVKDGDLYRFYVVGTGSEGFKRDPYARELEMDGYPDCDCIVCDPAAYGWHDSGFRAPDFSDLIVYQFHIGVFYAKDDTGKDIRSHRECKILDVVDRIEYFADLGVNAVMPLPFQEFQGENSLGYNGTDLFSPEMDYSVREKDLAPYLARVNRLLTAKGFAALTANQIKGQINQFKVFIDLCHLYGIAVITDVVYNHAGGGFDDQSIKFFDRQPYTSDNNSLYFTDQDHAGGRVFAFWKKEVRQFLIDNGKALLEEYHVDGLRYDQVTVIAESGGWYFAQDLTNTLRFMKPSAVQIAEYWGGERWKGVAAPPYGMGFDIGYSDTLRDTLREIIAETTGGRQAHVSLEKLRDAFYLTYKNPGRWTVFQCIENHDLLDYNHTGRDRQPRIASLADPTNPRSWYARSRAKVATGLLLTAPGVPMIFMGQEFLEDKYWTDWLGRPELLIWWEGLEGKDKAMSDQHRFTRDLMWLRRKYPALRGEGLNVFHVHNGNRVIAFHRWVPNIGRDVVVVVSLNEGTFYNHSYRIGFPIGGHWNEVFNSDIYDEWFNPNAQGNPGGITANGPEWDGLPTSAQVTLPANSILVFARGAGDF
ncbi:alpha amylase C-terminal domain-containing protein [Methylovulum miyakonense]|uniref:alpha amylase C-terminal domain-containing protein n=1 Tax=Methylovulum miyakonense TaxID=645578 RepID=UPI000372345F|nr:alpha-amylase family glycosyl hydrolase [Methylovulum miyakonense]